MNQCTISLKLLEFLRLFQDISIIRALAICCYLCVIDARIYSIFYFNC